MFDDRYGLTKAVLEGRKTMTRRSVPEKLIRAIEGGVPGFAVMESKFKVGEVVAVAQSYKDTGNYPESYIIDEFHPNIEFEAGWNNKMFVRADLMPHQIRITNVRVERMRDISDEDCLREGIYELPFWEYSWEDNGAIFDEPRDAFADLIDKISGKGTFESNPWVYVYEFELVK